MTDDHTTDTTPRPDMRARIEILAATGNLDIPEACMTGVIANFLILSAHMKIVQDAAATAPHDPAELLRP